MTARVTERVKIKAKVQPGKQRIDRTAVSQVTNGPGVRRDLRRRANNVARCQRDHVPTRTGKLKGTIRVIEGGHLRGQRATITVATGRPGMTPYLGYIVNGTKPHTIRPRRAKALRFTSGGAVIFAREVRHPGTRKNDFISASTRFWRP